MDYIFASNEKVICICCKSGILKPYEFWTTTYCDCGKMYYSGTIGLITYEFDHIYKFINRFNNPDDNVIFNILTNNTINCNYFINKPFKNLRRQILTLVL